MGIVNIGKDVAPVSDLINGHIVVGTAAVQLTLSIRVSRGVLLRCPGAEDPVPNTDPVWVGRANVTADSSATGGTPILPGGSLFIPVDDPGGVYVISTAPGQDVSWIGM